MKVRHEHTGAEFDVPDDWERVVPDDPAAARVSVVALEPRDPDDHEAFRANWVLTALPNAGADLEQWQEASDALLAERLPEYVLLDFEYADVAQRRGVRRLAQYTGPRGEALVMEQWATAIDDVGLTLTATIDTLRYDVAADDLETMASTLDVPAPGPGITRRGGQDAR